MEIYSKILRFETKEKLGIFDITDKIKKVASRSGISDGLCFVQALHSTAAVIFSEDESGLREDFIKLAQQAIPDLNFKHNLIDNNAKSHLLSAILGQSKIMAIDNSSLQRGTWQNILFFELDGPRSERKVLVKILGE